MKELKKYISEGFFNNVGANPLDSLLTEVIQYILDSQSSVLSNYVNIIGSNIGCNGVNYSGVVHMLVMMYYEY